MAYMTNGKGPYPHKAGEFYRNHRPGARSHTLRHGNCSLDVEARQQGMRRGKPASCEAGTSDEMAAAGWVGLYLEKDQPLYAWETPVETDELTEAVVTNSALDLSMLRPSHFTRFPCMSITGKCEAETVAQNIMLICKRRGDHWGVLTRDDYKAEREKDGNFTSGELHYFDEIYPQIDSVIGAIGFSVMWASAAQAAIAAATPKQPESDLLGELLKACCAGRAFVVECHSNEYGLRKVACAKALALIDAAIAKAKAEQLATSASGVCGS